MRKKTQIFLVGNPNAGKSSLFNQLTGLSQKTANYPGVTVEKKVGICTLSPTLAVEITDLPGCYSLYPTSLDEEVVIEELCCNPPDLVLVVGDASNLQRSLLLFSQVNDLQLNTALVLNMVDELSTKGLKLDIAALEKSLGVPVFVANSKKGIGIEQIRDYIKEHHFSKPAITYFQAERFGLGLSAAQLIASEISPYALWHIALNKKLHHLIPASFDISPLLKKIEDSSFLNTIKRSETIERYSQTERVVKNTIEKSAPSILGNKTPFLDSILLHPVWGYVSFFVILLLVFQAVYTFSSIPMDWIDIIFSDIAQRILALNPNSILIKLLAEGIVSGIGGVVMFIPQIACLYTCITILEDSGYMARVVFLMDKIMRYFGMSGKSILPMISGAACAIPAITATRNINSVKARLITILTIPFITCSARLPVYAILISLVIPNQTFFGIFSQRGLVLFLFYILGACMVIITAFILKKILRVPEKEMLIMEMPPYRIPQFKNMLHAAIDAVGGFIEGAGKIIIALSIILWCLASFGPSISTINSKNEYIKPTTSSNIENSYIGHVGKAIEPVITPLGYNWQIGIALLTSFAAREVFVGTMATLYAVDSNSDEENTTLVEKLAQQKTKAGTPLFTLTTGLSLMIFYTLALQCTSTIATIKKETNSWKMALGIFVYMTTLAYMASFITFRIFS